MIVDPEKFPTWGYPQSQWDTAKHEARSKMIEKARSVARNFLSRLMYH